MPDFKRLNTTRLYLAQSASQLDARMGYLLPESVEPVPDLISLSASLTQYQGAYLFFPKLPQTNDDLDTFIGNAYAFLKAPGREGTRFVWFASTTGMLDGEILRVDSGPVTADRIDFIFQNFSLRLVKGNRISASADNLALEFQPSSGDDNVLIVTPRGIEPPVSFSTAVPVRLPLLTEENSGCFTFEVESNQDGANALDIGLRYFMPSPEDPEYANSLRYPVFDLAPPTTMNLGAVADATELALGATFDPLDQLNPKRTYFIVRVPAAAAGNGVTAIRSYFLNPLGEPMRLVPGAASRLVFNTLAQFTSGDQNVAQPYYLAPSGDYGITTAASANVKANPGQFNSNVVCGLSSVEYVALDTQAPTDISFVDNSDAWAPATYNLDPISGETKVQFGNLTRAARTSWVWFRSTSGNVGYFAQPDSSVLYVPPQTVEALDAPGFLSYGAIKAGELAPADARGGGVNGQGNPAFPMVAYRGIQGNSISLFQQLELQVLNPQRRQLIPDAPPEIIGARGAAANPGSGTTPQGLLVRLDGQNWKGLTLAESLLKSARSVTPPAPPYPPVYTADSDGALLLYDVIDPLRGALLSNQVFLVISAGPKLLGSCSVPYILTSLILESLNRTANVPVNVTDKLKPLLNQTFVSVPAFQNAVKNVLTEPEYREFGNVITSYAADFKLTIEGFEFDLSPYVWDRYRTIILLKFQKQSIAELVSDVSNWSRAADFNDSPSSTQQTIQAIIQDARDRNDPDLQEFRDIVDDKNWNGILALNVKVPLTGLPPELQGLAAGIDPAQFIAHHVGISVTPVQLVGQSLLAQASSLFALIDYNDTSELQSSASGYQYRVRSLKIVMRNSAIAAFSSQVDLLVNRLFGDSSQLIGQPRNIITFNGVYQTQGGQDAYVFVSVERNVFKMGSQMLDQVVVSGAQFVTLGQVSTPSGLKVKAKFLLSGSVVFRVLSGFDVLSFGDPATGAGLAFSNLSVDLTFDAVIPSYKEFAFDASAISVDAATSLARPASLYSHFPLKLTGLVAGGAESRPDKQNYMPVVTPLSSNGLNDNWFGLAFSLNLGTPGALAAQVGFNAGFIAAWSPATSQLSLFIGLSLPGVKGGERAITLQGALKLTFGDISFLASGASYILQLRNIALSIFGISLPPSGQTNIVLFGDPAGKDHDTIGWYAAYAKSGGTPSKTRQLPGLDDAVLTSIARARTQVSRISTGPERLLRSLEPDPPDLSA
jgi:hypothetical protein